MDYATTEIYFLGVTVTKVGNRLETDLCCKPTDTHQYLHAQHVTVTCIKDLLHTGRLSGLKEFVQQKKILITILSN